MKEWTSAPASCTTGLHLLEHLQCCWASPWPRWLKPSLKLNIIFTYIQVLTFLCPVHFNISILRGSYQCNTFQICVCSDNILHDQWTHCNILLLRCWIRIPTGPRGVCKASCLIAGSDGAARVRCSGCSIVRDSGGVLSVQLLQSAFVLCLSCCLDLFNMQLLLYTPARAPIRCQARVVEQCLRALHLNPESYQLLSLCASGWAWSWV